MKKRSKMLIILTIVIVLVLGIAIPNVLFNSQCDVPEGVWYESSALVSNPIEQFLVLGFKLTEDHAKDISYHLEVKTIFGLTYADVYFTDNGSFIERRLLFLN
jgi:hypothetical protein